MPPSSTRPAAPRSLYHYWSRRELLLLEASSQGWAQFGANALKDLVADVTAAMATGALRPADPLTTALALWSSMHGVAALWTATPNLPPDLAHTVGDLAQNAVLTGLAK